MIFGKRKGNGVSFCAKCKSQAQRDVQENSGSADLFLKVLLAGWLVYFFIALLADHFLPNMHFSFFLRDNYPDGTNDWFRDFVEVNRAGLAGDCYLTGDCANYPPLVLVIAGIFGFFTPGARSALSHYVVGQSPLARGLYFGFATLTIGAFAALLVGYLVENSPKWGGKKVFSVTAGLVFSYPLLFAFERGNYILLAMAFFAVFVLCYETRPTVSAVALALSACIKIYPALFFFLFLADRKYKALFAGIAVGLAGLFLPMAALQGGPLVQLRGLFAGVFSFNGHSQTVGGAPLPFYLIEQHSNSFSNLFRLPGLCLTRGGRLAAEMQLPIRILAAACGVATVLLSAMMIIGFFLDRDSCRRMLLLLSAILLLPSNTFDYMPVLFLPVLALMLCRNERGDRKYIGLLTLLACTPKVYFFLHYPLDVSIQTVLNPLLMTVMVTLIFLDGWRAFLRKTKHERSKKCLEI